MCANFIWGLTIVQYSVLRRNLSAEEFAKIQNTPGITFVTQKKLVIINFMWLDMWFYVFWFTKK